MCPQVSMTLPSIQADLNNAMVFMALIVPVISRSFGISFAVFLWGFCMASWFGCK